jgi:hypothetical protein
VRRVRRDLVSACLAIAIASATMLASTDAHAVKNALLLNVMKRIGGFAAAGNMGATVKLLTYVRAMGPAEYAGWNAATEKVAAAARAGDAAALKSACNGCHDQYRESYRSKYGSKSGDGKGPTPIPVPVPNQR